MKYNNYSKKTYARPAGNDPKSFKGIKAEQFDELGGRYAITINPEDPRGDNKHSFTSEATTAEEELREVYDTHINNIFKKLKYCEVLLCPELSPTGRLHYHGVLTVIDTVMFLWHDVQVIRESAQCEIDTIEDITKWETYISKQAHLMARKGFKPLHLKNRQTENTKE